VDSGVTERPDMRDYLIAHVIGDLRGTRRSCPDIWSLAAGGRQSSNCGQAGLTAPPTIARTPGVLSWLTRIPGQRPAIPRARRRRSRRPPRAAGQHNRPVHHLVQHHACGERLGRIAEQAVAFCGAGLRRDRVHAQRPKRSSPERTAPASAGSRTACTGTAYPPGRPSTPRRPQVRTDYRSDSSPASFRSAAGPRCPARCPVVIARHVASAVPAWPAPGPGASHAHDQPVPLYR
jgi:hypothetical protein